MTKATTPKNTTESIAAFKSAVDSGLHIHATVYEWIDKKYGNSYFSYKIQCGDHIVFSEYDIQYGYGDAGSYAIREHIGNMYGQDKDWCSWYSKDPQGEDIHCRLHIEKHRTTKRTMLSYGAR